MKRRTFIGSLLAGLGAVCLPWRRRKRKKSQEEIAQEIVAEWSKHANDPSRGTLLFATLAFPLRVRRDYAAVGRQTFQVEKLPDGALPFYDKEP